MVAISLLKSFSKIFIVAIFAVLFFLPMKQSFASTTSALLPTSDGTYLQWSTKSGASHFAMVDESSCDGNTSFNRETTVGGRDSYGIVISSVPNGATITQIDVTPCASKNTSGGLNTTFNVFYRLDGVDSADAGAYTLTTTTPAGLSTTSYTGLSTVKSGSSTLEVGGVYAAGNRGVKLSQVATVITYIFPPTVTASAASSVTTTTATLNSLVNPNGQSTTANYRYGTSNVGCSSLPTVTSSTGVGSGTSNVSNPLGIASLSANTTYYFCATATNADGTTYGGVNSFTTQNPPTVTTNSASSVGTNSAILNSTANPNGLSTTVQYRYGTSNVACSSLPSTTSTVGIGSGTSDVSPNSKTISLLSTSTTYYFCATANSVAGTTYGFVNSFTTLP